MSMRVRLARWAADRLLRAAGMGGIEAVRLSGVLAARAQEYRDRSAAQCRAGRRAT